MKEALMREVRIWVSDTLLQVIDRSVLEYGSCRANFIHDAISEKIDRETPESRLRNQSGTVPPLSLF